MSKTRKPRIRKLATPDRSDMVPAIQAAAVTRTTVAPDGTKRTAVIRAPIATRAEWDDPADTNTSGSRTARQVSGYRRTDPLQLLHRRGEHVTKQMLQDAERYRDDFEVGVQGAKSGSGMSIGISGARAGGFTDRQAMALARYRAANAAVGRAAEAVLGDVVLGLMDMTTWAAARGVSRQHATGLLVAALRSLRHHYETLDQATLRPRRVIEQTLRQKGA